MKITMEIDSIENFKAWSGGKDTLDGIINLGYDYINKLNDLAEEVFTDGCTETELNDWLWFDREFIYNDLGLDENGEIPEDDDDDYEELLENVSEVSIRDWIDATKLIAIEERDFSKTYYYNITETKCIMLSWETGYDPKEGYALEFSVRERESSFFVYDWAYVEDDIYGFTYCEEIFEFPEIGKEEEFLVDTDDLITMIEDAIKTII